jgi:hypothetical protein
LNPTTTTNYLLWKETKMPADTIESKMGVGPEVTKKRPKPSLYTSPRSLSLIVGDYFREEK